MKLVYVLVGASILAFFISTRFTYIPNPTGSLEEVRLQFTEYLTDHNVTWEIDSIATGDLQLWVYENGSSVLFMNSGRNELRLIHQSWLEYRQKYELK